MTSQRRREMYDIGRWARTVSPAPRNVRRWRYFLDTLDLRFALLRHQEPIDSRIVPWRTFETPLSAAVPGPIRPVRLRLGSPSANPRDARGRFLPKLERAP